MPIITDETTKKIDLSKCPKVTVNLSGVDGNVYAILGTVNRALRKAKWTPEQIQAFKDEATSGDYDHVLQTCMKYLDVE